MMKCYLKKNRQRILIFLIGLILFAGLAEYVCADLIVNILAVNGTDKSKDKEVKEYLPRELAAEDIFDTGGLKLKYDVNVGSYYVYKNVSLEAKETKTFKVRIRDVWKIEPEQIEGIKEQINIGLRNVEDTEYYELGEKKRKGLFQRLDFIVDEEEKCADNIEKRIDRYRIYSSELERIRSNALSVVYWRDKLPSPDGKNIVKFVVEVENPLKDKSKIVKQKHYLPQEVRPEHFVSTEGFDVRYDPVRGQGYLTKEEELKPAEKKRYEFNIIDIWRIDQPEIDNLRNRTRETYKLLEKTKYLDNAKYLVASIKKNLERIELSQSEDRVIQEHISAFRINEKYFKKAVNDVDALEDLLKALRENLERSKLKNVLQRIKTLKAVKEVAKAVIWTKPTINNAWKIILGIMVFVAMLTAIHFSIWGRRSKKLKAKKKAEEEKKEGN